MNYIGLKLFKCGSMNPEGFTLDVEQTPWPKGVLITLPSLKDLEL